VYGPGFEAGMGEAKSKLSGLAPVDSQGEHSMKIIRKTLVAAAVGASLATLGSPVLANPVDLSSGKLTMQAVDSGVFDTIYSFTMSAFGDLKIAASSNSMTVNLGDLGKFELPAVTFTGWNLTSTAGDFTSGGNSFTTTGNSFTYIAKHLQPGTYLFELMGTTVSSTQAEALSLDLPSVYGIRAAAMVPEPGEWAMILAGIGILGATVRRRVTR